MATLNEIQTACYIYLSEQKTALWGDWEIQDPGRRRLAAIWLADQIEGVYLSIERNAAREKCGCDNGVVHYTAIEDPTVTWTAPCPNCQAPAAPPI